MNMNMKLNTIYGNWTTRGYANSRIANSQTRRCRQKNEN